MTNDQIKQEAISHFSQLIDSQLARIDVLKEQDSWVDYSKKKKLVIGICWGDGIGEEISKQAQRVLAFSLKKAIDCGRIEFRIIDGLTIENRAEKMAAI